MSINNYGLWAAKRRQKKKAEMQEQAKAPSKSTKKKSVTPPNLDWDPLNHPQVKMPKHPINWNDESTQKHSDALLEAYLSGKDLQLLKMPAGTGKTAVAIATIGKLQAHLKATGCLTEAQSLPFIVACPPNVLSGCGWHNTIVSWNANHPNNKLQPTIITSIDRFAKSGLDVKTFAKVVKALGQHGMIVLDEVHKYKNPTGRRSKQLQKYRAFKRLALSATPLTNNVVMDSISYLVMGNYYDNKTDFIRKSDLDKWKGDRGQYLIYNEDGSVDPKRWKYYYSHVIPQMSEIFYMPEIDLTDLDMPEIKSTIIQMPRNEQLSADLRSLAKAYKKRMFDGFVDYFMEYVHRLHDDKQRLDKLDEILKNSELKQPLIFYQNTDVLNTLENHLKSKGITNYQIVSGAHSYGDLDLERNAPIFVQYQSGAEGIEMKNSNCSIFYQNQTSYATLDQARSRNRRRGMKDSTIHHYYLLADDPFEQRIFDVVRNREEVSEQMLEEIMNECIKELD